MRFLPGHTVFHFARADAVEELVHLIQHVGGIVPLLFEAAGGFGDVRLQFMIDGRAHPDAAYGDIPDGPRLRWNVGSFPL